MRVIRAPEVISPHTLSGRGTKQFHKLYRILCPCHMAKSGICICATASPNIRPISTMPLLMQLRVSGMRAESFVCSGVPRALQRWSRLQPLHVCSDIGLIRNIRAQAGGNNAGMASHDVRATEITGEEFTSLQAVIDRC
jgi:hypothetical protein